MPKTLLNPEVGKIVRGVFQAYPHAAWNGDMTLGDVVDMVKQIRPQTRVATVAACVNAYGPVGVDDDVWLRTGQSDR